MKPSSATAGRRRPSVTGFHSEVDIPIDRQPPRRRRPQELFSHSLIVKGYINQAEGENAERECAAQVEVA